jgi:trehalose 2-sulfotransferase
MVCDDIAGTGILGKPFEYFIKVINEVFTEKAPPEYVRSSIYQALEKGLTENGVSAVKIMSNQLFPIGFALQYSSIVLRRNGDDSFYHFFKDSVFVRVVRKDKIAQAVSRVMAQQTDIYHSSDDLLDLKDVIAKVATTRDESHLTYRVDLIEQELSAISHEELVLDNFLNKFNIPCFEIIYENAIDDRSYVIEIAKLLGLGSICLKDRRLKKVSGSLAKEWVERFKLDRSW